MAAGSKGKGTAKTLRVHPRIRKAVGQLGITPRESQIVEGFASGRTTEKLAEELYISSATLRTHLRKIFTRLNVGSRVEMIAMVLDRVLKDVERKEAGRSARNSARGGVSRKDGPGVTP